jgi:HEAT repeat protein
MRPAVLLVTLFMCLIGFGCSRSDVPREKYFRGEPVEHWLEAIKSPDPKTRKKAADVLGNVGPVDPRAVPALIEAVKDRDAKVRDAAVLGLSKIGPPASSAESVLEEATKDKDLTVRAHAATALERVRGAK